MVNHVITEQQQKTNLILHQKIVYPGHDISVTQVEYLTHYIYLIHCYVLRNIHSELYNVQIKVYSTPLNGISLGNILLFNKLLLDIL